MTLDRVWLPALELRDLRHLGWYRRQDGKRLSEPWITPDGELDPGGLLGSELFQGQDVEPIVDSLLIPAAVCANPDRIVDYLRQQGWNWSPNDLPPTETSAWAARTATDVRFFLKPEGLLIDFRRFPRLDRKRTAGSARRSGLASCSYVWRQRRGQVFALRRTRQSSGATR